MNENKEINVEELKNKVKNMESNSKLIRQIKKTEMELNRHEKLFNQSKIKLNDLINKFKEN